VAASATGSTARPGADDVVRVAGRAGTHFDGGSAAFPFCARCRRAARKQAQVLAANLLAARRGEQPAARYNGYTSCPLVTARNRMLLAEFDYDLKPTPTIPLLNTMKPRYDMWLLKRYGLPALYWHGMLRGRL
jgi:hypothetical protein